MSPIVSLRVASAAAVPPSGSGGWIDAAFRHCVGSLLTLAAKLGISYHAINVWIFGILWPLLTLALIVVILTQRRRIMRLERSLRFAVSTKL